VAQTRKRAGKAPPKASKAPRELGAIRPVLLAAGLGLFWFVEHREAASDPAAPMWGYLVMQGVRVFVDFVGAWFVVSALQLVIAALRYGLVYLRARWQTALR
jgi:hypothetical protein